MIFQFLYPTLNCEQEDGQANEYDSDGGNPAFGKYDLATSMRVVLYPAFIGWSLIGIWIATLRYRIRLIEHKKNAIN